VELIILFVLFMILSSVVRALGGQGRSRKSPGKPGLPRPTAPRFPRIEEDELDEDLREISRPVSKPVSRERRPTTGGITGAEDPAAYLYPGLKSPRQVEELDQSRRRRSEAHQEMVKKDDRGRFGKKPTVKRQARSRSGVLSDPRQELARLLDSPHIALGVVVSEVLSAPRAHRPHRKGRK